jgi:hypothetical protein
LKTRVNALSLRLCPPYGSTAQDLVRMNAQHPVHRRLWPGIRLARSRIYGLRYRQHQSQL